MRLPKNAFTLVELLIVVSIITIVTGALMPSFTSYIKKQGLRQSQETLKSDLRSVQNKALTGANSNTLIGSQKPVYWGVKFLDGSGSYLFFLSLDTTCPSSVTERGTGSLSEGLEFINGGCVFFSFGDGGITTSEGFSSPIQITNTSGDTLDVYFNETGLIYTAND